MNNKVTIVTGLWDLGRANLQPPFTRSFDDYKAKFFELLKTDVQMCIWIPRELEQEVWQHRSKDNTQIYFKELEDFKTWFPFFKEVQDIRQDPNWYDQGWLKDSPQAQLEYYNPMMMCKMFMVNDSAIYNPFGSTHFYWIDGGITNTVPKEYFVEHNVFDKLPEYSNSINKFLTLNYPYESNSEIHGFKREVIAKYCETDFVHYVSRGGFWGGRKEIIHKINNLYYNILHNTICDGYMGADECLFTILTHTQPKLVHKFDIEGNGLIWPFFEMLKNFTKPSYKDKYEAMNAQGSGTSLYIVTFNSPPQLEMLLDSFKKTNPELLNVEEKYLINNSTDSSTDNDYNSIATREGFIQIKEGNMGICGARAWAADHFHQGNTKYLVWFEDDMLLYTNEDAKLCKNGLNTQIPNWLDKCINIVEEENLDFLKISFSEFFGDHHFQWSWHNVPEDVRQKYFADGTHRMQWQTSGCINGVSYLIGDVYYSNWPSVMTKAGNYKIFLETPYVAAYEQTMMSHAFQLSKQNKLHSGVLMASLINHNRRYFYAKEIRKEC